MNRVYLFPLALCASVVIFADHVSANEQVAAIAEAGDIDAGKKLYKKECRGCHGPTAKGVSSYPKLRGQTAEYLADRLTRYRKGEKFGPNTPLMAPKAKKLSDEDIVNLSAFIASLDQS
ncbi:MAG: c-type cytochrome [Silicimonas sp.]|nr:c-type cytochrome [Silicimonas sp.]